VTFSFYGVGGGEEEERILVDTTLLEEGLRDGSCTFGMNRHGEVCQIAKLGGVPIDAVALLHCVNVAAVKVKTISAFITKKLAEDAKRRNKGGILAELSAENER
jgi:exosome complex component RRP45